MTDDDLDEVLGREDDIVPSSGFGLRRYGGGAAGGIRTAAASVPMEASSSWLGRCGRCVARLSDLGRYRVLPKHGGPLNSGAAGIHPAL